MEVCTPFICRGIEEEAPVEVGLRRPDGWDGERWLLAPWQQHDNERRDRPQQKGQ